MIHVQGRRIETFTLKERVDGCHQQAQEKKTEALQAQYACCVRCSAGLTGSLIMDREAVDLHHSRHVATCSLLWVMSVSCVCVLQHMTSWVLRFITLLWESLPLPLQRKMATSRGKISHLTIFKFKMKYFTRTNNIFVCLFKKSPV